MTLNNFQRVLGFLLAVFRSFFKATIEIVWAFVGIILFLEFGKTYNVLQTSSISHLISVMSYLVKYWGVFFMAFFLWEFILGFKEFLIKDDKLGDKLGKEKVKEVKL
jgi:hypothetical protein